jgi:hypothetical protein
MKQVEIVVLGGCHVIGYPIGNKEAFPTLLGDLLQGKVVRQVPYLKFTHLSEQLPLLHELQPSHVVLQLGNYEFTASLRGLLQQYGYRIADSKKVVLKDDDPTEQQASKEAPLACAIRYARVLLLGLFTVLLWLFSSQHRRSFRALNSYIKEHPSTDFIFLSPFPCLKPADNAIRSLGSWLLRRRLVAQPNQHWVDSQQLLFPDKRLFVDGSHLNQSAHRVLAYGLAAAILSHIDYL